MKKNQTSSIPRLENYADFTSPDNDRGVAIDVKVKGDTAFSQVTIPEHMSGWQGPEQTYAHRGAVATILDTVMAFGGIHFLKRATVTKSITIEYFSMAPVNTKLRAEAKLVQKRGENEAILESVLRDSKGTIMARGTGTYALYSTDELRNLGRAQNPQLVLGPSPDQLNRGACKPEDLTRFQKIINPV